MSTKLCYCGPFLDASGYGEANRNFIMAFYEAGADIVTQKVSFTGKLHYDTAGAGIANELSERKIDYKIKIIHTTPDTYLTYYEKNKYNIGHLFWETDRLPSSWVAPCNKMQEIWTGTHENKAAIINSGVKVPVNVFPEPINVETPDVVPWQLPNFNGFVFYTIAEWNERKDHKTLIHAFWNEFKDDSNVALVVKTHKGTYSDQGAKEIIEEVTSWRDALGFKPACRLFISTALLSEEGKHKLHAMGDCYVTANRGEGWGIPIVEAFLHTKNVIAPRETGVMTWIPVRNQHPVECDLVPIDRIYNRYYEPGMNWYQAKPESLQKHMRKVYQRTLNKKTDLLFNVGAKAGGNLCRAIFNFKHVGEQMLYRLQQIDKTL